jgi:ornithine carbamoyltransferase
MKNLKHILSIYDLTSKEIWTIIQSAIKLKKQKKIKVSIER